MLPWEVQIQPEAERLIGWPHTDPEPSPDLVQRRFNPEAPNQLWNGDITYIATDEGWLYLATVIDLFGRQVMDWSLQPHMQTSLVKDALAMAWWRRRPAAGLIFHSDRGANTAAGEFLDTLRRFQGCERPLQVGSVSPPRQKPVLHQGLDAINWRVPVLTVKLAPRHRTPAPHLSGSDRTPFIRTQRRARASLPPSHSQG